MWQLLVVGQGGEERRISLDAAEAILGRDPGVEVALPSDGKVSRRHARIYRRDGQMWAEDLGSANGTLLDGQPLTAPTELAAGSTLKVGHTEVVLLKVGAVPRSARFSLLGEHALVLRQRVALPEGALEVGRGPGNALVLDHPSISRSHAVVHVQEGAAKVEDLTSSNGTFVNGQRVMKQALRHGDALRFGEVGWRVEEAGQRDGGRPKPARPPRQRPPGPRFKVSWQKVQRWALRAGAAAAACVGLGGAGWLVHHLLTGKGPMAMRSPVLTGTTLGVQEEAWAVEVRANVANGQARLASQDPNAAVAAFAQALREDPISAPARQGLAQAEDLRDAQAALTAAQVALAAHRPQGALLELWRLDSQGPWAEAAAELTRQAQAELAAKALQEAQAACQAAHWATCQLRAASALTVQGGRPSPPALALVLEAEEMMRIERRPFSAWNDAYTSRTLAKRYPDAEVREAVMRYASGDATTAQRRLKTFAGRRGAFTAGNLVQAVLRAQEAGNVAAAEHDVPRALAAWERALAADARLVPADHASAPAWVLRQAITGELLRQGNGAFDRGMYTDAFAAWQRGLHLDPQHGELGAALARLERRAAGLLTDAGGDAQPSAEACRRLADVLLMTRSDSLVHRKAKTRQQGCARRP